MFNTDDAYGNFFISDFIFSWAPKQENIKVIENVNQMTAPVALAEAIIDVDVIETYNTPTEENLSL